jgi:hypothetical protein
MSGSRYFEARGLHLAGERQLDHNEFLEVLNVVEIVAGH